MQTFQNLYEVRKTVRFELKPLNFTCNYEKKNPYKLSTLIAKHKDFIDLLSKTLFYKEIEVIEKKEEKTLNVFGKFFSENNFEIEKNEREYDFYKHEIYKTVRFDYKGVKKVFKSEWIENKEEITLQRDKENKTSFALDENGNYKKKNKNYMTMGDLGERNFIRPYFEKVLTENFNSNKELESLNRQDNFFARKSDILFEIQKLNSKDLLGNLYFLFEGGYVKHKNDVSIIEELKNKLGEVKNIINSFLEELKPSQSFGIMTDYISLNYYTRSKTEKMYDVEILKKTIRLEEHYKGNLREMYGINTNQAIEKLYKEMKTFKANQKSAFLQLLQNKVEYKDLKVPFTFTDNKEIKHENYKIKLFDEIKPKKENGKIIATPQEVYEEILQITQKIEKESDKKQRTLLKEKRGKYLMGNVHFQKYYDFCCEYKKVAIEYGKRKAEKMSLEREKIESRKERGFGIISTDGKNRFLNTFSIENTENAYKTFKKKEFRSKNEIEYFILSSITLRALEKLCFKENSSFMKDLLGKIDSQYTKMIEQGEKGKVKVLKFRKELEEENIYISFLNEILNRQTTLGIIYSEGEKSKEILKDSQSIDEFEINLKKETYVLDNFFMSKKDFEENIKKLDGKTYKITSWDLEKERGKPEFYTKTWFHFWDKNNSKNKFPIRINPEINIGFVEKNEEWKKEEQNKNQTNNRRNRDRFLMFSTFSYNADSKYINNAFIKDDERIKSIEEFNKNYNSSKNKYFYGLDKGVLELATLGIYEKENDTIKPVILDKIDIYKITSKGFQTTKEVVNKDGKNKTHYLKNNPSLFIDDYITDNSIFEKQNITSCLGDLSCAKVLKGKIILNADVNTYNKLQEINIKRLLYKAITEGKCKSDVVKFHKDENVFSYIFENRGKDEEKKFNFGKNINVSDFEKDLNEYMKHVRDKNSDEDVSINKINNLKNAICANMVGVIIELQKYYPGFIIWENVGNDWVLDQEENKGNVVIGNLINEKIYNKLELLNEVPPILKKFRSEIKENTQHGKVIYINKDASSSACPNCEENKTLLNKKEKEIFKLGGHLSDFEKEMKHLTNPEYEEWLKNESFKQFNIYKGKITPNKYQAGNINGKTCDFHLQNPNFPEFSFITSGDDLATYNIAKKGIEYLESLQKT